MKRRHSDSNTSRPSGSSTKRQCRYDGAPCPAPPTQTLALTEESLRNSQCLTPDTRESPIHHWRSCVSTTDLKEMEAPPTPRSAAPIDCRRRQIHRLGRSQGRRTPSPSKRPTPQTLRTRNMHHANVFVDTSMDLPHSIDTKVRDILSIRCLEDRVTATEDTSLTSAHVSKAAAKYRDESRRNARECSLEGDWRASLYGLLRDMSNIWSSELKVHMSEKVWHSDLKPTGPSFEEFTNEDRSSTHNRYIPHTALPEPTSIEGAASVVTFVGSVPSLPQPSVAPTTSTEAADPYHISTPKPDTTVGLAHGGFLHSHQQKLVNHQVSGSILSDPHVADMGIRFPFLVAEVKGLSLNGSLVSAQNQAAISGASMVTILQDLMHKTSQHANSASKPELSLRLDDMLCFSVVTAGPVHELWVHFKVEGAHHMECLRSLRTTLERDALEFTSCVYRVLEWGRGAFKDDIVVKLEKL